MNWRGWFHALGETGSGSILDIEMDCVRHELLRLQLRLALVERRLTALEKTVKTTEPPTA